VAGVQSSSQPHIAGGGAASGSVAAVAGGVPVQQTAPQIARETPPTSPGNQRRRNLSETYTQVPGAVTAALQQQQTQRPTRYGYMDRVGVTVTQLLCFRCTVAMLPLHGCYVVRYHTKMYLFFARGKAVSDQGFCHAPPPPPCLEGFCRT
jgi:hypothetical protein